jgi:hypothetical protein
MRSPPLIGDESTDGLFRFDPPSGSRSRPTLGRLHETFRHQAIDGTGNLNGQDAGDRLSVFGHHKLIALGDPSEVLAQMVAKISNADFHRLSRCGYIVTLYCSHSVREGARSRIPLGLGRLRRSCTQIPARDNSVQGVSQAVGRLRQAGRTPHFDIALPDLAGTTLGHLRTVFGPPTANLGRQREHPGGGRMTRMKEDRRWDLWVDFHRVDADGLTHASLKDASEEAVIEPGRYVIVGDEDADPAVAHVVDVRANGVVLLRVHTGHADQHLDLLGRSPA